MMFDYIQKELQKRYPDRLAEGRRWIFNVAGGAMGQLTVLYCSPKEYLIFFGTPIGTEGFSGRFKHADVYDIMLEGEMQTYTEGEFTPHTFLPGETALLAKGTGKGYRIKDHAFMLEYMRGNILPAMKFGIWSSTANNTLDWHSAWNQIHDCGKIALREIFGDHPKH
jgi:C-8 sterol isomerase